MYQYQWRKWSCQDMYVIFSYLTCSFPSLHRLLLKKKPHILTSHIIQTFRRPTTRPPPVRTTSAPQYQRRTPSMVWNTCDGWNSLVSPLNVFLDAFFYEWTVRRYQPCFYYSCLFGCFFILKLLITLHHLDPVHTSPLLHDSCFMLTPSLLIHYSDMMSVPPRCIATHVLRFVESWFFCSFCGGKTLWISLFLHLLEGKPPPFSVLIFIPPLSLHYLPHTSCRFLYSSISHYLEVAFLSPFNSYVFKLLFVIYTTFLSFFSFFFSLFFHN